MFVFFNIFYIFYKKNLIETDNKNKTNNEIKMVNINNKTRKQNKAKQNKRGEEANTAISNAVWQPEVVATCLQTYSENHPWSI